MGCSIPQASLLGCMHLEGQLVQGAQVQNGNCILEGHQNLDLMNSNGSCRQEEHQALDPGTLLFSISSTGWSRLVVIGRRERWVVIYWVLWLVVHMTWYCSYLYIQIPSKIIKILCPLMQYEELGIHDMNLIFSPIFFLESGCESTWPGFPALCRRSACPRPQRNPVLPDPGRRPLGAGPGRKVSPTEPLSPSHRRRLQSQFQEPSEDVARGVAGLEPLFAGARPHSLQGQPSPRHTGRRAWGLISSAEDRESWLVFPCTLKKIFILLLLDEVVYKQQLSPFGWVLYANFLSSIYINYWEECWYSNYCGTTCFSFQFYQFCFTCFETLLLGLYTSRIIIYSWWIYLFIIM